MYRIQPPSRVPSSISVANGSYQSECYNEEAIALPISNSLNPSIDDALQRAGAWFLNSGIRERTGGVARYYLSDSGRNAPVSSEITGYTVSALLYLDSLIPGRRYLQAAEQSAQFLLHDAWSESSATFPFEPVVNGGPAYAYFFDCGIIARGLLAAWRATGRREYFERAKECGLSMAFDFMAEEAMHPVLRLPEKQPLAPEQRWARRPGCYQLKSALAWNELAIETGHRELASAFDRMVNYSLTTQEGFLPGESDPFRIMDRLHAYGYFLEAVLFVSGRPELAGTVASGVKRMDALLSLIAPAFVRCDVCAQLLRVRLFADQMGFCPLDRAAAEQEAASILEFQAGGSDPRMAGGFFFGKKQGGWMPFVNPVTTAFAAQALAMWREYDDGGIRTPLLALI